MAFFDTFTLAGVISVVLMIVAAIWLFRSR